MEYEKPGELLNLLLGEGELTDSQRGRLSALLAEAPLDLLEKTVFKVRSRWVEEEIVGSINASGAGAKLVLRMVSLAGNDRARLAMAAMRNTTLSDEKALEILAAELGQEAVGEGQEERLAVWDWALERAWTQSVVDGKLFGVARLDTAVLQRVAASKLWQDPRVRRAVMDSIDDGQLEWCANHGVAWQPGEIFDRLKDMERRGVLLSALANVRVAGMLTREEKKWAWSRFTGRLADGVRRMIGAD